MLPRTKINLLVCTVVLSIFTAKVLAQAFSLNVYAHLDSKNASIGFVKIDQGALVLGGRYERTLFRLDTSETSWTLYAPKYGVHVKAGSDGHLNLNVGEKIVGTLNDAVLGRGQESSIIVPVGFKGSQGDDVLYASTCRTSQYNFGMQFFLKRKGDLLPECRTKITFEYVLPN